MRIDASWLGRRVGVPVLAGLIILGAGCGAGGPSGTSTLTASDTSASARPAPEVPKTGAPELPAVVRPLPSDAVFYAYVHGGRFRLSPLRSIYASLAAEVGRSPDAEVKRACGFDPLDELGAVALAGHVVPGSGFSVVAVLELDRGPQAALECLKKLGGRDDPHLGGIALDHDLVAFKAGRFVVIGEPKSARLVSARVGEKAVSNLPAPLRVALQEHPEALLVAAGRLDQAMTESPFGWGRLHVDSLPDRFVLHAEADTSDPNAARAYAAEFDPSPLFAGKSELPRFRTSLRNDRIVWELTVQGGATEQAHRLGMALAVVIKGVRRYIANAKTAEAKNMVPQIAKELVVYAATLPQTQRRFPPSAPPTPKRVPKGKKTLMTAADWSHPTWKALKFFDTNPVYYSYEIVTAPGGKRAVVRATGDLDGDGVTSRFSQQLEIDVQGEVRISPALIIENEFE